MKNYFSLYTFLLITILVVTISCTKISEIAQNPNLSMKATRPKTPIEL